MKIILFYFFKYRLRYYEFLIIIAMKFEKWKLIESYINKRKDIMIEIRKYY